MVGLDTRATDCYRKGSDGLWVLHPFARGDAVALASVAITLTAAQLFAEVAESLSAGPGLSDSGVSSPSEPR